MCIIKAHNAKVDYVVVKRNYFSDNSLSPETPNRDSPILFMCNSLHPQLKSYSHRLQPLFYFSPPYSFPSNPCFQHVTRCTYVFSFFFIHLPHFVFFCFRSIWLCDIRQRANWVHTFIMKECISVPGQKFVQTCKHIIYVLKQKKWTTDWPCTLGLAKENCLQELEIWIVDTFACLTELRVIVLDCRACRWCWTVLIAITTLPGSNSEIKEASRVGQYHKYPQQKKALNIWQIY